MDEISIIETLIEEKLNGQFSHVDEIPNEKYNLDEKSDFWLKHPDKLVRLQFIKLIAESQKSTLGLTEKELIWTVRFLQWSINEKMEFVPFIKKILKRINENNSLQERKLKTLQKTLIFETKNKTSEELFNEFYANYEKEKSEAEKIIQSYNNFFHGQNYLLNFLKSKIGQSAVHFQNQSSLQIISLMQDIFDEKIYGPLDDDFLKVVYECMLLNSYESNKEICFDILVKSKTDYLKGKVFETVRVAVELANSMRPIDGITSTLMLRLAVVSSDFMEEIKKFKIIENVEKIDDCKSKKDLAVLIILINALEEQLQVADKSIVLAASKYSLFGPLYCIRNILSHVNLKETQKADLWKKVTKNLISICFRLSKAASEIVNNSSPEGHLPMDLDPQHLQDFLSPDSDLEVTPQMVLLCSWRSVKEVSLLFGEITSKAPIETESSKGLITETEIEEIGEHFVTLLCETKHRGAFEQAHVGFTMLCARLWRLQNSRIKDLPKIWLRRLIIEISGLTHSNTKLCATRRSAGVPFMVQAIVTSEKDRKKNPSTLTLHSVMKILIGLSQLKESENVGLEIKQTILETELFKDEQGNEFISDFKTDSLTVIKSHALNILRTLVKNAQLGDLIQDYISDCLISAVRSYDGISWTERNAATLLFSALVTRIFGVQRTRDHLKLSHHNKLTGYKFFKKYPKLLDFMLQELVNFTEDNCMSIKPAVQSVLLILSRLCPSQSSDISDAEWKIDEFIDLTSRCGESRVYKTRELAARALVQFLTEDNLDQVLSKLMSTALVMVSSFNAAHGYCLQIMEVIESGLLFNSKPPVNKFIYFFEQIHDDVLLNLEVTSPKPACYPLATVCINILNTLLQPETFSDKEIMNELRDHPIKSRIFETSERQLMSHVKEKCLKDRPGRQNYENTILTFYNEASVKPDYNGVFPYDGLFREDYNHPLNNRCTEMFLNFKVSSSTDVWRYERVLSSTACALIHNSSTEMLIDPDFRSIVYKFLYTWNIHSNPNSEYTYHILMMQTLEWALKLQDHKVFLSDGFFLVLQKALTTVLRKTDFNTEFEIMEFLKKEHCAAVFRVFVNNSWMGNSSLECRREISEAIGYLYVDQLITILNRGFFNIIGFEYHWWTTVLHLLLDDDEKVRQNAAKIVCNIEPKGKEVCAERSLCDFFQKFGDRFCRKWPPMGTIFLFSWGVNLLQDEDFEMDESDVFTKSHNYTFLDFEKLADLCVTIIEYYCEYITKDGFVDYRETYMQLKNNYMKTSRVELPFKTFDELFRQYETHPVITDELENLLDPIYDKKLLQHRIYEKFRKLKKKVY